MGPLPISDEGTSSSPSVAFNGTDHLVVWSARPSDNQPHEVYAALVSGDGDSAGGALNLSSSSLADTEPDVASNGSRYLVVWQQQGGGVRGQLVSANGLKVGVQAPLGPSRGQAPAVAATGSSFYVVWEDERNGNTDIFGARISNNGDQPDVAGKAVTTDTRSETAPDVAWNGANFLVTHQLQFGAEDEDVYSRLVNSSAVAIGQPQVISGHGAYVLFPAVASDGKDWLVVWSDYLTNVVDIRGRKVDGYGVPGRQHPDRRGADERQLPGVGVQPDLPGRLVQEPGQRHQGRHRGATGGIGR